MNPANPASALVALGLSVGLLHVAGCGATTAPGTEQSQAFGEGDVRVLFVGNSLTYVNDLPGVVGTISEAAGKSVATLSIAKPNYAIQDHWAAGLAQRIRTLGPDFVVLQQGPSSLPDSRVNLVVWTDSVGRVAREVGAVPVLLMVWPEVQRLEAFDAVRESYRAAAEQVDGVFAPAGEAFRALHELHPELEPYGADGFHPSAFGTVVSALVVVRSLFGVRVTGLPAHMTPTDQRRPTVHLDTAAAAILQAVADTAIDVWGADSSSGPLPVALNIPGR